MPHIFRGFIVLLLNPRIGTEEKYTEFQTLIQSMVLLIGAYKEAELYLERYLIQLSDENLLLIIRRIQFLISYNYEQNELDNEVWDPIQVLDVVYKANLKREHREINYREFYNDEINNSVKLDE